MPQPISDIVQLKYCMSGCPTKYYLIKYFCFVLQYLYRILHDSSSKSYIYQQYLFAMTMLRYISFALYICQCRNKPRTRITESSNECVRPSREAGDVLLTESNKDPEATQTIQLADVDRDYNVQIPFWTFLDGFCYLFYVPLSLAGPTMTFKVFLEQVLLNYCSSFLYNALYIFLIVFFILFCKN